MAVPGKTTVFFLPGSGLSLSLQHPFSGKKTFHTRKWCLSDDGAETYPEGQVLPLVASLGGDDENDHGLTKPC